MNWAKSKTLWFAALTTIGGFVQDNVGLIPPEQAGKAIFGIGVLTGILRLVTTKPVSEK